MDIKDIEQIITILKQNDVTEFELDQDGTKIKLSRASVMGAASVAMASASLGVVEPAITPGSGAVPPAVHAGQNGTAAVPSNVLKVESPIVGTFYRRPSPDAEPFVKEGDRVRKGQTLCIVEAMKLMNEIEAPAAGRIEKINLSDGQVVEFGEVIMLITPE